MTPTPSTTRISGPQGELLLRVDRASGTDVPLLFVHSDAGRLEQWDGVVDLLADREHPLARLDLRGHGASDEARDDDYSFGGRAADLEAALGHLGWDRVVLVAHSGGCGSAVELALAHPERVAGLLLVDPPTDPAALPEEMRREFVAGLAGKDSLQYLGQYYRTIAGSDETVVQRVLTDAAATTPASRKGLGPALLSWDPAAVTRVSAPVRVVGSDVTDGPAAVWAQHPDVPHRVVHGTGHWVDIERPDEVVAELRLLLDAIG